MIIIGKSTQTVKEINIRQSDNNVYLSQLSIGNFFKESDYINKIKTVNFVDYINKEEIDAALKTYELGDTTYLADASDIIGWIDKDYNLYIGSDWNIYSKDFSYAFYNMSAVTRISFNNLNLSENTNLAYTFYGNSSLINLNLSTFNTANVTNMQYMFNSCSSLANVDMSNATFDKVTTYSNMFDGVNSKISIVVKDLDAKAFIDLRLSESSIAEGTTSIS